MRSSPVPTSKFRSSLPSEGTRHVLAVYLPSALVVVVFCLASWRQIAQFTNHEHDDCISWLRTQIAKIQLQFVLHWRDHYFRGTETQVLQRCTVLEDMSFQLFHPETFSANSERRGGTNVHLFCRRNNSKTDWSTSKKSFPEFHLLWNRPKKYWNSQPKLDRVQNA